MNTTKIPTQKKKLESGLRYADDIVRPHLTDYGVILNQFILISQWVSNCVITYPHIHNRPLDVARGFHVHMMDKIILMLNRQHRDQYRRLL